MNQNTIYSTLDGTIRVTITGDMETLLLNIHDNEDFIEGDWPGNLYRIDLETRQPVEIPQA